MLKLTNLLKRIILNSFLIYTFNIIAVNFNFNIPINIWTIIFVGIFDVSGIVILTILKSMII